MISVTGNIWEEIKYNKQLSQKVKQDHKFSDILSKLIINKNFDKEEVYSIHNKVDIINPFINNLDFELSKSIIIKKYNYQFY